MPKSVWIDESRTSISVHGCIGLDDVEAVNDNFPLAPTDKWQGKEEGRQTMWAILCTDRLYSSTTEWHPQVDVKQVKPFAMIG
jgi:hypothetical protein